MDQVELKYNAQAGLRDGFVAAFVVKDDGLETPFADSEVCEFLQAQGLVEGDYTYCITSDHDKMVFVKNKSIAAQAVLRYGIKAYDLANV